MSKLSSYIQLTKPRLTFLAVLSGIVGFIGGSSEIKFFDFFNLFHITLILILIGSACNIVNQAVEANLDKLMKRTATRPIPNGEVKKQQALILGYLLLFIGLIYSLLAFSSFLTFLSFLTFFSYIFLYTPMKQKTAFNTIIGAFPGAAPILIGWLAGTNNILPSYLALIAFFILFLWQLPHFFAIAWMNREDYKKANFKMISDYDENGKLISSLIFISSIALFFASLLPMFFMKSYDSLYYFFLLFILNLLMILLSLAIFFKRNKYMKLYFLYVTIFYLPAIFFVLILFQS